jgi:hypothetical protein
MIEQERHHQGAGAEKATVGRASHPPNTESCAREGGIGPEVAACENGGRNRTTLAKRRPGTPRAVRRSRTLLKQFSLERHNSGGDGFAQPAPNTTESATGEDLVGLAGSESMARWEREAGNLGRPLCLLGRHQAVRGRSDQRKKTDRRVSRGESDRLTVGRGKCLVSSKASDPSRKGRRNNGACNGNMSRWDKAGE